MTKRVAKPARPHEASQRQRGVLTRDPEWARDAIARLRGECHPKQLAAADDPADLVSLLVPRGGGKTTAAEVRLVKTLTRKRKARCLFVAPTKEHAAEICWEPLKELFVNLGIEIRAGEVRRTITLVKNGSVLRLGGADDKREVEKYRGPEYDGVVVEEAASWDPEILEWFLDRAVRPRQGGVDGWVMAIGSPGHILRGPFYEATRPGGTEHRPYEDRKRPEFAGWEGWSSHTWSLEYAAQHVPKIAKLWAKALKTKALKGWGDKNPVWMREYEGKWAMDSTTMVFSGFQPYAEDGKTFRNLWESKLDKQGLALAALPKDLGPWHFALIFDKGAGRRDLDDDGRTRPGRAKEAEADEAKDGKGDPFAVNVFAFAPTDVHRRIWHVYGFEATRGMPARSCACLLLGTKDGTTMPYDGPRPRGLIGATGWPDAIVGDCDQGLLDELLLYGIPAEKADKKQDTKTTAIEEVNGDFDEGRIFILKGSALEEQLQGLQWKVDGFGILRENKAQANHSTDCLVYGRRAITKLFESGAVEADAPAKKAPARRTVSVPAPPRAAPEDDEDDDQPSGSSFLRELGGFLAPDTYDGWP